MKRGSGEMIRELLVSLRKSAWINLFLIGLTTPTLYLLYLLLRSWLVFDVNSPLAPHKFEGQGYTVLEVILYWDQEHGLQEKKDFYYQVLHGNDEFTAVSVSFGQPLEVGPHEFPAMQMDA